ncbi:D-alanyl-D-alanine carboxypeptidase family protein [Polycladospora coralii]|nr:D-alanyl-D-alanine carboxypeptidase family protein [Polycladospora coralii]
MLKSFWAKVLVCHLFCMFFVPTLSVKAEQNLAPEAQSAILMDANSGTIIFEKNGNKRLAPASITKVMTMLLIMEAIEKKKIALNDEVNVSEYAASMGGSQIFLEPGEKMRVDELLKAISIASANDASVAMAEYIGGTEEQFVEMMNKKAKQMGLKNTHFQNPNGLPAENHYSSARDIALLSKELLNYEQITKYTGLYQDYLRQDTKKPFWLVNTNRLVRFYDGLDGLKTGYTSIAKFCLTATAKKNDFRLIAVVMGEPNGKKRNQEVTRMLDYGFSQYTSHIVFRKGDLIAQKEIEKGDPEQVQIRAKHPFSLLLKKGDDPKQYQQKIRWSNLQAPIPEGEVLGHLTYEKDGKSVAHMELVTTEKIEEASFWTTIKHTLNEVLFISDEKEKVVD